MADETSGAAVIEQAGAGDAPDPDFDWRRVAFLTLVSRAMDKLEEERLVPERKVLYQFSARGHDMAQVMLGTRLSHRRDAAGGYYRSRPLLLALACRSRTLWAREWAGPGAIRTAAISESSSTTPIRAARRRFPCREASAPSTRRPQAGLRRSNITAMCWATAATKARWRWCWAAMPPAPPAASGPP
jgi:hypothetical protein